MSTEFFFYPEGREETEQIFQGPTATQADFWWTTGYILTTEMTTQFFVFPIKKNGLDYLIKWY